MVKVGKREEKEAKEKGRKKEAKRGRKKEAKGREREITRINSTHFLFPQVCLY
jgi:ribosomal protein S8E